MLTVLVTMVPKPDRSAELEKVLGELLDVVRQEPGCAAIHWGRVVGKDEFAIVERYLDEQARQTHLATDHMKEFGPKVGALLAAAPTSVLFEET